LCFWSLLRARGGKQQTTQETASANLIGAST
jgi:hypothetical protein